MRRKRVLRGLKWISAILSAATLALFLSGKWASHSYTLRIQGGPRIELLDGDLFLFLCDRPVRPPNRPGPTFGFGFHELTYSDFYWSAWWEYALERRRWWRPTFGFSQWYSWIAVPLWIPSALFAAIAVFAWWRCRPRGRPGDCPACGYDLTGNISGRCPECGRPVAL